MRSSIWAEEVNNTGDKRLINKYNKFVEEFDYFKKNFHLSHEAWIAFYDGEIEWIAVYPESDIISLKRGIKGLFEARYIEKD